ncbi:MAG: UDP-N-acetylmuramoyl-L-alanine--D-glutamate ligase, partial [Lapillicoccus sp.]
MSRFESAPFDPSYEPRPGLTHRDADWSGLRVLVTGLGVSGFAAADALAERGARVSIVDGLAPGVRAANDERANILGILDIVVRQGEEHTTSLPPEDVDLVVTSPGWRPDQPLLLEAEARGIP